MTSKYQTWGFVATGQGAKNSPYITGNKSSIGHLLGAAGGVESVFTALSILHNKIPPTINIKNKVRFERLSMLFTVLRICWVSNILAS